MEYALVILIALAASTLTFFTGFGLGTVMLAAFVLVFPVALAVPACALVHLSNNFFKLFLVMKHASRKVVLAFGIPALLSAFAGAWALNSVLYLPPLASYEFLGSRHELLPVKLLIGILMAVFALLDLSGKSETWVFEEKLMPLGGVLSGFFGGLSGHQGAFRTMFLLKAGITKEELIGSGAVIACMVDTARLSVYFKQLIGSGLEKHGALLMAAIAAAVTGSILGNRLLKKVSLRNIEFVASILLLVISVLLSSGMI